MHTGYVAISDTLVSHVRQATNTVVGVSKPGGRTEFALPLEAPWLSELAERASALMLEFNVAPRQQPLSLVFASVLLASSFEGADQAFHADDLVDASAMRVVVYVTDVNSEDEGAIEFEKENGGSVMGPAGTAVVYKASTQHRGRANRNTSKPRLAVAFAFSSNISREVTTIGSPDGFWFVDSQANGNIVLALLLPSLPDSESTIKCDQTVALYSRNSDDYYEAQAFTVSEYATEGVLLMRVSTVTTVYQLLDTSIAFSYVSGSTAQNVIYTFSRRGPAGAVGNDGTNGTNANSIVIGFLLLLIFILAYRLAKKRAN